MFKTRPRTELIWAGCGLIFLAAAVVVVAVIAGVLYSKFTRWTGKDMTISADAYADFLVAYRAFFFGVCPGIAVISGTAAWYIFKNLKRIADDRARAA